MTACRLPIKKNKAYIYMVITCSKGKDHANPACGQLNRENVFFRPRSRLRIWSRETGSAVPSRVSLLISTLRLNLVRLPSDCSPIALQPQKCGRKSLRGSKKWTSPLDYILPGTCCGELLGDQLPLGSIAEY